MQSRLRHSSLGMVIGVPFGGTAAVTNNVAMEAELATYISGLATPLSADILGKINTFVAGYKSDDGLTNLSDAYDVMYYLGNETAESSLRNLVKRAHDAVAVNSPTFTPYEGWAGDGISSYITSNYTPSTDKENYDLNDCSCGFYERTTSNGKCNMGGENTGAGLTSLWSANNGASLYCGLNQAYNTTPVWTSSGGSLGMVIQTRITVGLLSVFHRTTKKDMSSAVNSIPTGTQWLMCYNRNASAQALSTAQLSFAFYGKGLSDASETFLYDRFQALMTANGKQV